MALQWQHVETIESRAYTCGYCNVRVGAHQGLMSGPKPPIHRLYMCPHCGCPTYFDHRGRQTPGVAFGGAVDHLPGEIAALYTEARNCMAVNAFTGAVLLSRKLLVHIAVAEGAPEDKPFTVYVEHLASKGYVPPNARGWINRIRLKSNEANHEIQLMERGDAEELLTFIEMLLRLAFEFPGRVSPPPSPPT